MGTDITSNANLHANPPQLPAAGRCSIEVAGGSVTRRSRLQRGGAQVQVAGGSVVVWAATTAASAGAEIFSVCFSIIFLKSQQEDIANIQYPRQETGFICFLEEQQLPAAGRCSGRGGRW